MKILQLTVHYSPNVGGVETHLTDLVSGLLKKGHSVFVLTYRPLVSNAPYQRLEKVGNYTVVRIPWIRGLFYTFKGVFQFLYTLPGLFLVTPLSILLYNPDVIHAHGIVAGFIGVYWGKAFGKRVVISTHSLYEFPQKGVYRNFATGIFKRADVVLTLSKQSAKEIENLGIRKEKIKVFTYWVDLTKFTILNSKFKMKEKVRWRGKFVVFFVGRLVPEKGLPELLDSVKTWNENICLVIAGAGPMEKAVEERAKQNKNIIFLGNADQEKLPEYYNAADLVIVPSTHEEGFGRVILESLACGTPVIGSNRGAIPEAMDNSVGELIDVTPNSIRKVVERFYKNIDLLGKKAYNARKFAEKRYSEKNLDSIISSFK